MGEGYYLTFTKWTIMALARNTLCVPFFAGKEMGHGSFDKTITTDNIVYVNTYCFCFHNKQTVI